MIGAHRLPLRFDDAPLREEVAAIGGRAAWVDHWISEPGAWGVIPLLSQSGDHAGADSIHFTGWTPPKATAVLETAPRLREVLDSFKTRVLHARLSRLSAGKSIQRHRDYGYSGDQRWSFERGFIRVHIPIVTDENVTWTLAGKPLDMQPGEVWYLNVCQPHSVDNRSARDRVHLVMELEVNDWVRSLFPRETSWDKAWGIVLRRFEPPLWKLVRRVWGVRRYFAARAPKRTARRAVEQ
jgi:hypothetical protein